MTHTVILAVLTVLLATILFRDVRAIINDIK